LDDAHHILINWDFDLLIKKAHGEQDAEMARVCHTRHGHIELTMLRVLSSTVDNDTREGHALSAMDRSRKDQSHWDLPPPGFHSIGYLGHWNSGQGRFGAVIEFYHDGPITQFFGGSAPSLRKSRSGIKVSDQSKSITL
jgi:hypothetical protein